MRSLSHLPVLEHIEAAGECLMGVTHLGQLPIYRYVPLQAALHSGQEVSLAYRWPEHLTLFVYRYSPVPVLSASQLPPGLAGRFGRSVRQADRLRPWDQATYQGWPLYVCTLDRPGSPAAGTVANLFECMNVDVLPLPPPGNQELGP